MFSEQTMVNATFFINFRSTISSAGMSDSTLVNKCKEGDQRAQRKLFEKYAPKMMGVCMRYMKNTDLAEDVLQEGFVKVFTKLDFFKGDGSLEGWIRRIIVNTALDHLRKNLKFRDDQDVDEVGYRIEQSTYSGDPLNEEDLLKLINGMPAGYRIVFNMFAIEGYSHKEIADELGISENTSKSQYSRARAYLQTRLKSLGFEREG